MTLVEYDRNSFAMMFAVLCLLEPQYTAFLRVIKNIKWILQKGNLVWNLKKTQKQQRETRYLAETEDCWNLQ